MPVRFTPRRDKDGWIIIALESVNEGTEEMARMNEALSLPSLENRNRLEQWASQGVLFALVDPFFEIPTPLEKARLDTRDTDPMFYDVIAWDQVTYQPPSLVRIDVVMLDWIMHSLATERWGIFVVAETDLQTLARHFQKFVITRGPDSNPYFLRFHDASVLEVLMQTWTDKEKNVFYGPAIAFGLPDLDTLQVRVELNPFSLKTKQLPAPEDCLLQLHDSQLRLCGEAIDRDLVKVIYWHLRNHHSRSVQFLDKSVLEDRVTFAIQKARRYGLGTVSDLAGYAALMFELAPNFDDHPSFRMILEDPSTPSEAKMRKLAQVITDQEWREVLDLYDRNFWSSVLKSKKR